MTTTWKTVRVFIISTFRDMQAERDHMVRFVFPRLREQLLPHRIHLVDVDLRWGVTSEQDASEVCREIIHECRPRFLCLLGGRYGWVPPGKTRSITADEVHYGVLDRTLSERGFAYFYFRADEATAAMMETAPGEFRELSGSDHQTKLAELKQAIRAAGLHPFPYPAQWDNESGRLTGLKQFGDRVYEDLLDSLKSDLELRDHFVTDAAAQPDDFAEENAAMEAFVEERSERFVLGSRATVLEELLAHASATGGNGYVCLTGAPGSGKSALLAHLYRRLTDLVHPSSFIPHPSLIVPHFVGASPGSTDVRRTLRRLCHALKAGCADITTDIPDDPEKLRLAFPEFLRQASAQQRVVLLLDAVNQFDAASHSAGLHWLPEELPDNARVILSALDSPALEELRRRRYKPREIELKPLTADDGAAIIEQFRQRYRKQFELDQRAALLAKTDAGTPLYLLAALEELRTLGTYEEITQRIAELPPRTHELFAWILKRLENDDGFRDAAGRRVGRELVPRFAALLGASRYGLSQRELTDLLDAGDPQGNVAALLHLLRPYLMRRGELLDFYHDQFREAAKEAWLKMDGQCQAAHKQLADFFRGQADTEQDQSWKGESSRPFVELAFHLARSDIDELVQVLLDFKWLQVKTNKGLLYALIQDYDEALAELLANHPERRSIELIHGSLRLSFHVLSRDPNQLIEQLIGRLLNQNILSVQVLLQKARQEKEAMIWLRPLASCFAVPGSPLLYTLQTNGPLGALCVTPDGRKAISGDHYGGGCLRVWDLEQMTCLCTFEGHTGSIASVCSLNDSRTVLSSSDDSTVIMWDASSASELRRWGLQYGSTFLCQLPNSRTALSCDQSSGTLGLWDMESQVIACSQSWHLNRQEISAACVCPDGYKIAYVYDDGSLNIWNSSTGEESIFGMAPLRSRGQHVTAIGFLPNSRQMVLGYSDGSLVVWDRVSQAVAVALDGHSREVSAVCALPDGQRIISSSNDGTIKVWDLSKTERFQNQRKHDGQVTSVCELARDYQVASASVDGCVRIWDSNTGILHMTIEGRNGKIVDVRAMPDQNHILLARNEADWGPGFLDIHDIKSGGYISTLSRTNRPIITAQLLPDGKQIVVLCMDGVLRAFDSNIGSQIWSLECRESRITAISVVSGRQQFLTGHRDGALRLWDINSLAQIHVFPSQGYEYDVVSLCVEVGEKFVVSAFIVQDMMIPTLRVYDLETGLEVGILPDYSRRGTTLVPLPLPGHVLSASTYRSIAVWNLQKRELAYWFDAAEFLTCCTCTRKGAIVIAGDEAGGMYFLRLDGLGSGGSSTGSPFGTDPGTGEST